MFASRLGRSSPPNLSTNSRRSFIFFSSTRRRSDWSLMTYGVSAMMRFVFTMCLVVLRKKNPKIGMSPRSGILVTLLMTLSDIRPPMRMVC